MTTTTTKQSSDGAAAESSSPERLQSAAGEIVDTAGRAAQGQASDAMTRAGEGLEQVAEALRGTSNQLRQEQPQIASFADTGAQRVEQLAAYLREHDAREAVDEAERFARRQPALLIAGGLAAGLVLGRLLRSGAEPQTTSMGQGRDGGSAQGRTAWLGSGAAGSSSMPGSGYGTGYGASYTTPDSYASPDLNGDSTVADNLARTDAAASEG